MHDNNKHEKITVNEITENKKIEKVSEKPANNIDKDASCIYGNKRHAVGSKINFNDGTESICTDKDKGTWENKK